MRFIDDSLVYYLFASRAFERIVLGILMKRLSHEEQKLLQRHALRSHRHDLIREHSREERWQEVQRIRRTFLRRLPPDHRRTVPRDRVPLEVPTEFSLRRNYEETVGFLNEIRTLALLQRVPIFLRFGNISSIGVAAALALCAEVYRCRHVRPFRESIITGSYPLNGDVRALLQGMGFYKLLDVKDFDGDHRTSDATTEIQFLKFRSYNRVSPDQIADFKNAVLDSLGSVSAQIRRRTQSAMIEAIGNAHEHAYKQPVPFPPMSRRWWLGGSVDRSNHDVNFVLFDQGTGVPNTLDKRAIDRFRSLVQTGDIDSDGYRLMCATQLFRTGTLQPGRGKGFRTMKQLIDAVSGGDLWVLSNKGYYTYNSERQEAFGDHGQSLHGTLVNWRLQHMYAANQIEMKLEQPK